MEILKRGRLSRYTGTLVFIVTVSFLRIEQHFYCGYTEFNPRFSLFFWRRVSNEELAEGGIGVVDVKMLL